MTPEITEDRSGDKIATLFNGWTINESQFRRECLKISAGITLMPSRKLSDDEFDDDQYSRENGDGGIY